MSNSINWDDAKKMITKYQQDPLVIPAGNGKKLNGLIVDASHLQAIINNEEHEIEKVFMILGMKEDEENGKQVTLVLAGISTDGQIIVDNCYDYLDPCPENCHDLQSHLA